MRPSGVYFTMMSPNSSVVASLPWALISSSKAAPVSLGRLVEPARRHLLVLLFQGVDHLYRRQVDRRQPVGVEPHAHAVFLRAPYSEFADALYPREPVLHLGDRVVGEVDFVARSVWRYEVYGHQYVGIALVDVYADVAHFLRNPVFRLPHAVLDEHLRHVYVHAGLESYVYRPRTFGGGFA